jgi:hypothetical protein
MESRSSGSARPVLIAFLSQRGELWAKGDLNPHVLADTGT